MSRKLYVEGGGDSKALRAACRRGFRRFLEKAGVRRQPRIVACGSRENAYDSFCTALGQELGQATGQEGTALLLVDAEGPVGPRDPWDHLRSQDGWERPPAAGEDMCHLMVQVMESWFLADIDALTRFYGRDLNTNRLPANPEIEKISKQQVLQGLEQATRHSRKGKYGKGPESFEILASLDPKQVEEASPHARRFLKALR